MPDVTVIISVCDGAEFVGQAIESVLAQTHREVRVIVVDDGSTDATPAVLERFGPRITVVRQENRGLAAARNRVLPLAEGPYVAFLDHDDLWEPTFLARCITRLEQADDRVAGVVVGWMEIDCGGRELPGTRRALRGPITLADLLLGNQFPPGPVVLRRAAVVDVDGFDEALRAAPDWDLWLRLAAAGWRFVTLEECLWRYRRHERNMSNDPVPTRDEGVRLLDKLFAHPELPTELRTWRARAVTHVLLRASHHLYELDRTEEAARDFAAAVRVSPDMLRDDEAHYAIICIDQPLGHKASARYLDLDRGEARIVRALAACRDSGAIDDALYRHAMGRAYRALASLAYSQRRMRAVRGYATRALRIDPSLWRDRRTVAPLLKSFAGPRAIDALSRWRPRPRT